MSIHMFSVIYVCPYIGQGLVLVIFFSQKFLACVKRLTRLYLLKKVENSFLCAFSCHQDKSLYYPSAQFEKKNIAKFDMYKTHKAKEAELICHLFRFSYDLHGRVRHNNRKALAEDMDAPVTPTSKKWILQQRGKYINFVDKLRRQTTSNTRHSPCIFFYGFYLQYRYG